MLSQPGALLFQEDVYHNNHTSTWGSYYDRRTGKWGYKCCHSVIKMSYCTGEEGRRANEQYTSELGEWSWKGPMVSLFAPS